MDWVFAYGSNMDLDDVARWFRSKNRAMGSIADVVPGHLPDHRLVWNYRSPSRRAGAANVEPAAGSVVHGLVLRVDRVTLAGLDVKEGRGVRYERELLSVQPRDASRLQAWVYAALPAFRQGELVPPRREYLDLILGAAIRYCFPADYVDELRRIPVHGDGRTPSSSSRRK